jgi:dTDP-4-dehydrorhamnose reductase
MTRMLSSCPAIGEQRMTPKRQNRRPNERQRPSLMVTGASGNLGQWICRLAAKSYAVTGVHWRHPFAMEGVRSIRADLTDIPGLAPLLAAIEPAAVIHAAALSQPVQCEQHPKASRRMNVDVPEKMAALCAGRRIPFIFTSTDLVFDGLSAPYAEQDAVTPVCRYGRQKAEAEAAVLDVDAGALVCRLPLMIGVGGGASQNFSIQMLDHIRSRRPLRLLTDEFRTPVAYRDAAQGLLSLIGRVSGRLHLGGRQRVSRYDLGILMADQMGVAPTMIEPVTLQSLDWGVARSPDCSLISDKAFALGYDPAPLSEAIAGIVRQFNATINVTATRRG